MKRKSGQEWPSKRNKTTPSKPDAQGVQIRDGPGFTQLELAAGHAALLSGSAVLEVTTGCLQVFGALITPESGSLTLHAPGRLGRALQLAAAAPQAPKSPLAQSTQPVQAVLHHTAAPAAGQGEPGSSSFQLVDASRSDPPTAWQVPKEWGEAADSLTQAAAAAAAAAGGAPPVVAVLGSKGSGKSVFCRLLVNAWLSSGSCAAVAYLDLDPGQPELTPPGLLSLHLLQQPLFGPAHLQQRQPLQAFFQGDVSSQSEPGRFLAAVQALCSRYYSGLAAAGQQKQQHAAALPQVPLVVNTPGWITGLGLELLGEVLRCAAPSHVVSMCTPNPKKNLPDGCWWLDGLPQPAEGAAAAGAPALLQLPSVAVAAGAGAETAAASAAGPGISCQSGDTVTTTTAAGTKSGRSLSAVESRALAWLAWARRVSSSSSSQQQPGAEAPAAAAAAAAAVGGDEFAEAAAALAAATPFQVCLQDVRVELLHAQVTPAELAFAVNGMVVGLSASSSSSSLGPSAAAGATAGGGGSAEQRECLGLGLVRAVDARRQLLYLLTDLSEEQLQAVDTLVVGKLELPDRLQAAQQFASPYQGLYCLSSTATGAGVIKSRNNLLRSSLMRGGGR